MCYPLIIKTKGGNTMARGRKSYTLEEKLEKINSQIDEYTEQIISLKEQKKEIEKEIKNKKLLELYDAVQASGKSIEEVKEILSK